MKRWLTGKKTYIVSGLLATVSLVQVVVGDMTLQEFVMSDDITVLIEAMGFSTLRAGMAKGLLIRKN